MIEAVVFDLGETLVDETRLWRIIAEAVQVPFLTVAGVLGGVIERHEHHHRLFDALGVTSTHAIDHGYRLARDDFYPDALPVLTRLAAEGYRLGLAGNQPAGAVAQITALGLPVDLVAASEAWGISKPDPAFFARIGVELGLPPDRIAYVGDRLDNDVLPAQRAGMIGVFIRRGPWGYLHAAWPEMREVPWRIDSLTELPDLLASMASPNNIAT